MVRAGRVSGTHAVGGARGRRVPRAAPGHHLGHQDTETLTMNARGEGHEMVWLSNEQVAKIAANLGHDNLQVEQTPSGAYWICTCSCGYRCTRRYSSALAAEAAAHHMMTIVRRWQASGQPWPVTAEAVTEVIRAS